MLRFVLLLIVSVILARLFWRVVAAIVARLAGQREQSGVPAPGVQMVRDPVCGTYVVPDRALSITDGRTPAYFCSAGCRDKYRARPSTRPGRPERAGGRRA